MRRSNVRRSTTWLISSGRLRAASFFAVAKKTKVQKSRFNTKVHDGSDGSPGITVKLGLIAGNGRFPFLVLNAAKSLGHDVVVIAIKEEADKDLIDAAAGARAPIHFVSIGQLGTFLKILKEEN